MSIRSQGKAWQPGEVIVWRELLNDERAWLEVPVIVVRDDPELLVTYVPEGAPFRFPPGDFPTPDGRHPWFGRRGWEGHGALMLQRPGDGYAVWAFWDGPERRFDSWYINLQEPFRRSELGYDTQDLELDIVVLPDLSWQLKDEDVLEERIREGRYTVDQMRETRELASRLTALIDAGDLWWSESWADWTPDASWPTPALPDGWSQAQ